MRAELFWNTRTQFRTLQAGGRTFIFLFLLIELICFFTPSFLFTFCRIVFIILLSWILIGC